ncbi:MAG: hypothetical protein ACK456_10200 [Pseudanabaenaceae cyanobacterium]
MKNSPPDKKSPRKKPKSFRLSYSAGLLLLMVVIGGASGLIAYRFGQQALEGVTATPAGVKLPRPSAPATATPPASPKDKDNASPKPKPDKVSDNSYWMLSESEVIAGSNQVIRDGLAGVTVPVRFPEKPQQRRQRREVIADSLALSRNLDSRVSDKNVSERIAELRAELWQRSSLYSSLRSADSRIYSVAKVEPRTTNSFVGNNFSGNSGNNPSETREFYPKVSSSVGSSANADSSNSSNNYFLLSAPSGTESIARPNRDRLTDGSSFAMPLSSGTNRNPIP